jgi:regulatory protein YycI of two-component signal transduction system YycFG
MNRIFNWRFSMIIFLIVLGVVFLIWVISLFLQRKDKKSREKIIQDHVEEKKKQEEVENKSPFRDEQS